MRFTRQSIAAAATIVALGVLAAVALASGGSEPITTAPAPTAETDPSPQVRTEVVRRTVHRNAGAQASSSDDDGTLDQGPGDRPRIPVTAAPSATATGHDVGDDHGRHHGRDDRDDRGDDDDHDNSGPGSSSSGHGSGGDDDAFDDDSSGHGGGDDDSSGHGGGDEDSSGHGGGDSSGHGGDD
jgi:uncharacterized membrane protein YgcG